MVKTLLIDFEERELLMPLRRIKIEDLTEAPEIRKRTPLSVEFPEIAAMWHKTKNRNFKARPVLCWFKH
jgi:hypothetical protein